MCEYHTLLLYSRSIINICFSMDKNQIYALLKAKAKQYGFDKDEMSDVVEALLQNSQLSDEATEEEWNAQIDAVLPFLGVGQKMVNRILKSQKKDDPDPKPKPKADKDDKSGDDDTSKKKDDSDNGKDSAILAMLKAMKDEISAQRDEIASLKAEKVADTRKERLAKILDAESAFGKSTLKSFDRLKFENDEDFDNYLTEIEEVAKSIKQVDNDEKLDSMRSKPSGGAKKDPKKEATDAEIQALVDKM